MNKFNNEAYKKLTEDLIGNIFYTNTSFRTKISIIRQYTEVIVRKLLNIDSHKQITLGQSDIDSRLRSLPNYEYIASSIENIRKKGNLATHTQCLESFSEEDFNKIMDDLFNMLSFLLINYFEKYEFGSRNDILQSFSLLPPIIRYKILIFLYEKNPNNIMVIDKLVLAMVKAFDVETANEWVEKHKDYLIKTVSMSQVAFNEISRKYGKYIAEVLLYEAPCMYELCKNKILEVGNSISTNGRLTVY